MTFQEALNIVNNFTPDEETNKKNAEFLEKDVSPKLDKETQVKMKSVIDGIKQQQIAQKNQSQEDEKNKLQQQTKLPNGNIAGTAQNSNTVASAQISKTNTTAQVPKTSILTKNKK